MGTLRTGEGDVGTGVVVIRGVDAALLDILVYDIRRASCASGSSLDEFSV